MKSRLKNIDCKDSFANFMQPINLLDPQRTQTTNHPMSISRFGKEKLVIESLYWTAVPFFLIFFNLILGTEHNFCGANAYKQ